MQVKHIGIGELDATREEGAILKTMALGSCVSVVMLDPAKRTIGLCHIALPDSETDRVKALEMPGYFADTAITALLQKMASQGSDIRGKNFIIKMMGGANIMDASEIFNIGKRNILSVKKMLWQLKLPLHAEDVGGEISRTVEVFQNTGKIVLSCPKIGKWEI